MNITQHIPASLILGSVLAASASPVWAEGSVRVIGLPVELNGSFIESVKYDNAGESIAIVAFSSQINDERAVLYQYEQGEWRIVVEGSDKIPLRWIGGIAESGEAIAFSNEGEAYRASDAGLERLPSTWIGADGEPVTDAWIFSTALSGDGQTVGVYGFDPAVGGDVPLVWRGGKMLESLEIGMPNSAINNYIQAMNHDGSVIAGYSYLSGQINNIRLFRFVRVPWVWRDGTLVFIDIPNMDGLDELAISKCVSSDGTTVGGTLTRPTLVQSHLSSAMYSAVYEYTNWDGWVWSADEGVTVISDPRFNVIEVKDISADGQTLLLGCQSIDSQSTGSYLWTRDDGFVSIYKDLQERGILGPEEGFHCEAIDDDANTLMGWYSPARGDSTLAFIDLN